MTPAAAIDRCAECGLRMIRVDHHDTHPACDPDSPDATLIRAGRAAAQLRARQLADDGHDQTAHTAPGDHADALAIVHATALRMRILSANDLRGVPGWEHLHGPVRGAAITTAIRRGWIRHVGLEPSSSTATHGHRIGRYESLLYVERPALPGAHGYTTDPRPPAPPRHSEAAHDHHQLPEHRQHPDPRGTGATGRVGSSA